MKPLASYPLLSDQVSYAEITIIVRELRRVMAAVGTTDPCAVVEFGCYVGTTAVFLQRVISELAPGWSLDVYDSFAGLPEKIAADASVAGDQFKPGELTASKATLVRNFKQAGLRVPTIHKAWFSDLTPQDIPARIAFAYLDGDYYQSIADGLRLVTPHLVKGAAIVVDDYHSSALPGATKAVNQWLAAHPAWQVRHEQSLAIIRQQ